MQEINVEEIMNTIREEIKEKKMEGQPLQFADISMADDVFDVPTRYNENMMKKELVNLNGLWDTSLDAKVLSRGKIKGAVKKILNKAVCVIVRPHIEKQVIFNASVVNGINMLHCVARENEQQRKEIEALKKELETLKNK